MAEEGGVIVDEVVGACRARIEPGAGHGHHLAALVVGDAGGDERAWPLGCLDPDRTARQAGDDAIAAGEVLRLGAVDQGYFRLDEALLETSL